jgi:hypothetical protein
MIEPTLLLSPCTAAGFHQKQNHEGDWKILMKFECGFIGKMMCRNSDTAVIGDTSLALNGKP